MKKRNIVRILIFFNVIKYFQHRIGIGYKTTQIGKQHVV